MIFDGDIESNDVKISIENTSFKGYVRNIMHFDFLSPGGKRGGGVFRGRGVNRKNTVTYSKITGMIVNY